MVKYLKRETNKCRSKAKSSKPPKLIKISFFMSVFPQWFRRTGCFWPLARSKGWSLMNK